MGVLRFFGESIFKCEYCCGDLETQLHLNNDDDKSVWTICTDHRTGKRILSIITCENPPRVFNAEIKFCPMCGREF